MACVKSSEREEGRVRGTRQPSSGCRLRRWAKLKSQPTDPTRKFCTSVQPRGPLA
jgi:hypothetical protein